MFFERVKMLKTVLFGLIACIVLFMFCGCNFVKSVASTTSPSGLGPGRSNQEVWVTPNVTSGDFLDLFTKPDQWSQARSKITAFKFYDYMLRPGQCTICGLNTLGNFNQIVPEGAFRWLNNKGIRIGMEAGAVKSFNCGRPPDDAVSAALGAISSVRSSGGELSFIGMDEPFASGLPNQQGFDTSKHCDYTMDMAAEFVKYYIDQVHAYDPAVQVGLIEPYPYLSAGLIENSIDTLESKGVHLPFFHLDFDPGYTNIDFSGDIRELRNFCRNHGIPFGVILIGGHGDSSQSAVNGALIEAQRVQNILGLRNQEFILVQSWLDYKGDFNQRLYPNNLPETSSSTMMGLVNTILAIE